jgi:phosphoribosyl-AMP cyclohydrolase
MKIAMAEIKFDERGLVPAIVQDANTLEVLTLAYMNKESLKRTLAENETWFWSRSRKSLWHKGETSGNKQRVVDVTVDCDYDAVRVLVIPEGPACHTGAQTCSRRQKELDLKAVKLIWAKCSAAFMSSLSRESGKDRKVHTRPIYSIRAWTRFSKKSGRNAPRQSSRPRTMTAKLWLTSPLISSITSWCFSFSLV